MSVWNQVVTAKTELPTSGIVLYNENGDPVNRAQDYVDEMSSGEPSQVRPTPNPKPSQAKPSEDEQAEDIDATTEHTEFDNTDINLSEDHQEELMHHQDIRQR